MIEPAVKEPNNCKGRVYRYKKNNFVNSKGEVIYKEAFRPMKRLSCCGCEKCGWLTDCLSDTIPMLNQTLENDDLVVLTLTNISRDYESGQIDDFDIEFVKINQEIEK